MRCPKRNVKSEEKALELVNLQDPSATVKAFDEAFARLMQAIANNTARQQQQQHFRRLK
jgi:ABC-type uncharacterized transport system auxiliary subunit